MPGLGRSRKPPCGEIHDEVHDERVRDPRERSRLLERDELGAGEAARECPRRAYGTKRCSRATRSIIGTWMLSACDGTRYPGPNAYVVYPERRHLAPRVKAFSDFVSQAFAKEPV